ncbi:MAG TPA: hypothetical protein PK031_00735 [Pseudomonadales bacterium]|nr:hypothetical protein [Pseudomonadales bacterium]
MAITRVSNTSRMTPAKWVGVSILALFFIGGGIAHFIYTDDFALIVPPWMPYPRETVLATGVLELIFAALLFVPAARQRIGLWIAVYCLAVLPANVYMLQQNIPMFGYQAPPAILYFRIVLQAGVIALAIWSTNAKQHLVRYGLSGLFRG